MLALMAATLVVASGVALAVNKVGTNGPDLGAAEPRQRLRLSSLDLVYPTSEEGHVERG